MNYNNTTSCCSYEHALVSPKVLEERRSRNHIIQPHAMEEDFLSKHCGTIVNQWIAQLKQGTTETVPITNLEQVPTKYSSSKQLDQTRNYYLQKMNATQGSKSIKSKPTTTHRRPPSLIIPPSDSQQRPLKQRRHSVTSCSTPSSASSCSVESLYIDSPFSVTSDFSFHSSATLWSPTGTNFQIK